MAMNQNKKQLWQALKFTLFSISAGVIQIGSFSVLEIFIKEVFKTLLFNHGLIEYEWNSETI